MKAFLNNSNVIDEEDSKDEIDEMEESQLRIKNNEVEKRSLTNNSHLVDQSLAMKKGLQELRDFISLPEGIWISLIDA